MSVKVPAGIDLMVVVNAISELCDVMEVVVNNAEGTGTCQGGITLYTKHASMSAALGMPLEI